MTIQSSYNQEFCESLEYPLSIHFRKANQKEIRNLWCDGIIWYPLSTKTIISTAFIGEDGQDKYQLKIKFGQISNKEILRSGKTNAFDTFKSFLGCSNLLRAIQQFNFGFVFFKKNQLAIGESQINAVFQSDN